MLSRPTRLIAQGVALTGVVAGTVAFAGLDKSVALDVDGHTKKIHSFGSTVAEVLHSEGIKVGPHDLVSPATSAAVKDGTEVTVRYGRPLTITTDGVTSKHWTTAQTVDEALSQLGLRADTARLSVSRSMPLGRKGLSVTAGTRKDVTVLVGGKAVNRTTYTATVGALLAESHIKVGPLDRLLTKPSTRLQDGATIRLVRVLRKGGAASATVPFEVKRVTSNDLARGRTTVRTAGRPGVARVTFVDTWVDGKRTAHATTGRTLVRRPVTKVVVVGTKAPAPTRVRASSSGGSSSGGSSSGSASIPRSGGLNWAALAQCESGGNPQAVNPNGHYGLYQFSLQTWAGVGGSGNPVNASVAEQTRRAQMLYDSAGAGQWACGAHLFD